LLPSKPAGIKLMMSGRLKGKERGSSHLLSIGKVPIQSFSKTIFYAAEHIHTVYGVYGIKAWFFFDNQQKIL
jgi:ribosomal protein S3